MAAKNIFMNLRLSEHKLVVKEDPNTGHIKYGKKDDYPAYLLDLFNNHAEHGGIVKKKARYLTGKKIIAAVENPNIEALLNKINPEESAIDLRRKTDLDQVLFGGFAVKIVPNPLGQPLYAYHMDFGKIRFSGCGTKVFYSDDWSKGGMVEKDIYPIWKEGMKQAGVYIYKRYNPTVNKLESYYPGIEYRQCIVDIDTDKRVSTFFNALVRNNFSAGTVVTIFSQPEQKEKEYIVQNLTDDHGGEEQAGTTAVIFTNPNTGKGAEVVRLNGNDLDKQYQEVSKRNQQKIIMGHQVPFVLFGPQVEGALGQRNEREQALGEWINDYVELEQVHFNTFLQKFCKVKTGIATEFKVEQMKWDVDHMDPAVQAVMTNDEKRERMGLEPIKAAGNQVVFDALAALSPLVANKVLESMTEDEIRALASLPPKNPQAIDPATGQPTPVQQVNENIKGLKGREYGGLLRIARDYEKGRLSEVRALQMLAAGFGMSEEEARHFLNGAQTEEGIPVQQSAQKNRDQFFLELFDKYAHDVQDDEVIEVLMKSEAFVAGTVTEVRNAVLQLVKGGLTPEQIATSLKIEVSEVQQHVTWLQEKKLVESLKGILTPTKKALKKDTEVETEIYTEFRYALRDDVSGPPIKSTTRQFCRDMYTKTRTKALSMEAIEKLNNEFGENAWDYRGGFYNNGTEIEPWCRHIWKGETKIRRKKK